MIKGITPRLSEGGKIKIGRKGRWRKSKQGKDFQPPEKLDHFLITKTMRNDEDSDNFIVDSDLMEALPKSADGKVREIPIVLHSDNVDEVFPTAYARYAGQTCACRGDGESATQWEIKEGRRTGNAKSRKCPCDQRETDPPRCKATGVLHCSIAVQGRAVAGSVYKWRTTSIISIQEMIGSLLHIKQTCGVFRGLPLVLIVKPVRVRPKNQAPQTVYTCYVELRAKDLQSVQQQALQMAQMRQALQCDDSRSRQAYLALLSDPSEDNETDAEQADIADEFYPPETGSEPLQEGTHKVSSPPKEQQSEENDSKDGYREAIARIETAETIEAVHELTQGEKRKRVLAAAEERIAKLSKPEETQQEPKQELEEQKCQCHKSPNPPVRLQGATRCHRCGLAYATEQPDAVQRQEPEPEPEQSQQQELQQEPPQEEPPPQDDDDTPFGFTDEEAGF